MRVRPARDHEADELIALLDAALLAFDRRSVRARIGTDAVLVAVGSGHVRGAVVLDGAHIEAIAVRPRFRRQGVGKALIEAAADHRPVLTADGARRVRGFFEAVGFACEPEQDRRWFGRRS